MTLKRVYELPDPVHGAFCNAVLMTAQITRPSALSFTHKYQWFRESFLVENSIHAFKKPTL